MKDKTIIFIARLTILAGGVLFFIFTGWPTSSGRSLPSPEESAIRSTLQYVFIYAQENDGAFPDRILPHELNATRGFPATIDPESVTYHLPEGSRMNEVSPDAPVASIQYRDGSYVGFVAGFVRFEKDEPANQAR